MFDAIVVGARCAGSPTVMLLARRGYRVLLVDRARFPSDTISTHFIWPPGVMCLKRWGLFERVLATDCPIVGTVGLDLGEFRLVGNVPPFEGVAEMCAPRRTVLDKLLLDAAAEAGAEVREEFAVTGLIFSGDRVTGISSRAKSGVPIEERARIVIGADGRNSLVARAVKAEEYNDHPILTCVCYTYWRDVGSHIPGIHVLPRRLVISFPTNDGLTCTPIVFPYEELVSVRTNLARHLCDSIGRVANLAEPFSGAERVERIRGMGDLPNFFRKPYGAGWALVGDAGYHKDPILGQGISDAFLSTQWLADAVHQGLSGAWPLEEALAEYHRVRDEHFGPMYELCCSMAALEPPSPELQALHRALRDNPVERDRFFGTLGGTVPIPEFYAEENLRRITAGAAARA